jgi:hypothetical protein
LKLELGPFFLLKKPKQNKFLENFMDWNWKFLFELRNCPTLVVTYLVMDPSYMVHSHTKVYRYTLIITYNYLT